MFLSYHWQTNSKMIKTFFFFVNIRLFLFPAAKSHMTEIRYGAGILQLLRMTTKSDQEPILNDVECGTK